MRSSIEHSSHDGGQFPDHSTSGSGRVRRCHDSRSDAAWWSHRRAGITDPSHFLELFTSEGCTSCPPADALLHTLERNQPVAGVLIIPLSEHVDYWNRLGWHDPFSSPPLTKRQQTYVKALGARSAYTPQMVVDEQVEFVGSKPVTARKEIRRARRVPKTPLTLKATVAPNSHILTVHGEIERASHADAHDQIDVWFAVTESDLMTDVKAGENMFRRIYHTGVVRHLERINTFRERNTSPHHVEDPLRLEPEWNLDRRKAVVFLQERR